MKTLSAFIIIFLIITASRSFSQSLKAEYDSSRAYIQKNNFAGALPWLEKARTSAKVAPSDSNAYVEVTKLLAVCYARTGRQAEAEAAFKETIDLYLRMPERKTQLAGALMNFGVFYYNQKKYKEALPVFQQSLDLRKQSGGEKSAEYLSVLNSLAICQQSLKQYDKAEENFINLIALRKEIQGSTHPEYVQACNSLANLYKTINRPDKTITLYLDVLEAVKVNKGENSKEYAVALSNTAGAYKANNQFMPSETYYKKAHDTYYALLGENNIDYSIALMNLAGIYRLEGKYEAAEPLYMKAQNIFKEISGEISVEYASVLNNLSLFFSETGKYDQAETNYKYAIEISRQVLGEKHPETATTYNNLGLLYKNMGRYEQAEPVLKKALRIRKEVLGENHPDYAASLNNLAGLYENTGRYSEAEPLYKQSLVILKASSGDKSPDYASTLNNLAGVYEQQKKYPQAEPLYIEALVILKEIYGESHPDYATTLNNLALLQEGMGKKLEAEKIYQQNINATRAALGETHPNYATSLNNYAILLENMGRYDEAEKYFLHALSIRKEALGENHPAYTTTLYDLAKLYTANKNYVQADLYWTKALDKYLYQIDTYFPSMSEKEKGKFYQTISSKFEQFNSYVLIRQSQNPSIISKMYDNQLATKALLLNATNKVRQRILNSGDFILIDKYKNWNNQKELLSKAMIMSKEEIKQQGINLDELSNATNELEKELTASSEIFRTTNENKKITWIDVQKKLLPGESALEFIRFTKYRFDSAGVYTLDSIFYAALIISANTKNNPDLIVLKNGSELENQYLKYYRNSIKNRIDDEFSYGQFWSRIKKGLSGTKKVYVSPDGVYNLLNINALKNQQTKTYLTDELDITIVTNTKDLLAVQPLQNSEKHITLIGSPDFAFNTRNISSSYRGLTQDQAAFIERAGAGLLTPLPGTKVEVEKIAGMLCTHTWTTELYTEQNAVEENLKKQNSPKVLHIATHGFFEKDASDKKKTDKNTDEELEENPLLKSGLMLAGASLTLLKRKNEITNAELKVEKDKEDGILTAYEAMNLNLDKTDLVILSACETGLGEVKNGEGVYGLQRAFNVAGAKTIIISLWTVNDAATQKLMTGFYQEWLKVGDKRQAFKSAQKNLRKEFADPYFWGAFVMIGE